MNHYSPVEQIPSSFFENVAWAWTCKLKEKFRDCEFLCNNAKPLSHLLIELYTEPK
jgi:hypothetical protein